MYQATQYELVPGFCPVVHKAESASQRLARIQRYLRMRRDRAVVHALPLNDNALRFGAIGGFWQKEVAA